MKKILLLTGKTLAFIMVFISVLYLFSCVLKFKYHDGITPIDHFYDLPEDTVDVLLLGSSHMGMNVDPTILWDQEGIAAYNCWGSMQQTWNTYYYLKECLKYQNPKLVVMDVYGATFDGELSTYDNVVKNTEGLRLSKDKIDAIRVSATDEYFPSVLLGLPTYHYRYGEVNADDFHNFLWDKDTDIQYIDTTGLNIQSWQMKDIENVTDSQPLAPNCEEYFRKIVLMCKERNIPLLLVASPYYLSVEEEEKLNSISDIAEKEGVTFLNFNKDYSEIGLDTQTDYVDLAHMDNVGIKKYTSYLGRYIKTNYQISDRRNDANHIWAQRNKNEEVHKVYDLKEKFYGGGHNYLDTGVKLYANPYGSYTILAQIDTECESEDKIWLSCYREEEGNARGMLVHQSDGNIYIALDQTYSVEVPDYGKILNLAIVKNGLSYRVYADGVLIRETNRERIDGFEQTLLLGCEETTDGKRFRYSDTNINALEIYDIALSEVNIKYWEAKKLPDPPARVKMAAGDTATFRLSQIFKGDGVDKYLDTGVELFDNEEKSFTILSELVFEEKVSDGVYYSCFNEEAGNYHGLLVRLIEAGKLNIVYGNVSSEFEVPIEGSVKLAITKDADCYNIYLDGQKVVDNAYVDVEKYEGNMLIGCQETPEGEKFRYSAAALNDFVLFDGIMEEKDILSYTPAKLEMPAEKEASPVNYKLEKPFLGNGSDSYIDTGIQLYDVSDKSWDLKVNFRKTDSAGSRILTCFSENPKNYRGLIVTQINNNTLGLTLGNVSKEYELDPSPEVSLEIIKTGSEYSIIINGRLQDETVVSEVASYDGTLCLGCSVSEDNEYFRFVKAQIQSLEISGGNE